MSRESGHVFTCQCLQLSHFWTKGKNKLVDYPLLPHVNVCFLLLAAKKGVIHPFMSRSCFGVLAERSDMGLSQLQKPAFAHTACPKNTAAWKTLTFTLFRAGDKYIDKTKHSMWHVLSSNFSFKGSFSCIPWINSVRDRPLKLPRWMYRHFIQLPPWPARDDVTNMPPQPGGTSCKRSIPTPVT